MIGSLFENGRGIGITELLRVEGVAVVFFAIVTQLADVWFLFVLGGVLYVTGEDLPRWGVDRRRGLFVLGLVITYIALIGALKGLFVLPRPPGAGDPPSIAWIPPFLDVIFTDTTTADGPGFPSGHALGSTMVWGGLALVVERGRFRTRAAVAATIVGLVTFSRLALGVHYLVDVVVGVFVGVVSFDSVAAIGTAVGGWLVWRGIADSTPAHPANTGEVVAGFAVLLVSGGLFGVIYALKPSLVVTFVGSAAAAGGAVGAPLLGERLA